MPPKSGGCRPDCPSNPGNCGQQAVVAPCSTGSVCRDACRRGSASAAGPPFLAEGSRRRWSGKRVIRPAPCRYGQAGVKPRGNCSSPRSRPHRPKGDRGVGAAARLGFAMKGSTPSGSGCCSTGCRIRTCTLNSGAVPYRWYRKVRAKHEGPRRHDLRQPRRGYVRGVALSNHDVGSPPAQMGNGRTLSQRAGLPILVKPASPTMLSPACPRTASASLRVARR